MSTKKTATVTLEELERVLMGWDDEPAQPKPAERSPWVERVAATGAVATLELDEVLEVASEAPDGPLHAICTLIEGLFLKHAGDTATCAALSAIRNLHVLNLIDEVRTRG